MLTYDYVDEMLSKREPYRGLHLKHAATAKEDGSLVFGGALVDPVDTGILIFTAADRCVAEGFAKEDPYVTAGLVSTYTVREWTVVVGKDNLPKRKRKPTAYTTFMAKELPVHKAQHPELTHREAFASVAKEWKNAPTNPKNK